MFDGFWASFAPAFVIAFAVSFGFMLVVRTVQWTRYLVEKRATEKKSEMVLEALPWIALFASAVVTVYLLTRDARVTETPKKADPCVDVVDTGDDEEEVRERFPEDEVYSRS